MVVKPSLSLFAGMFGVIILLKDDITCRFVKIKVIILLENDITWRFVKIIDTFLKVFLQDLHIEISIHLSINLASISSTLPQHASPHHQRSSSKLLSPLHKHII